MENINYLLSLFNELPPDLDKIENELKINPYTPEEITTAACYFAEVCFCECRDFREEHNRNPLDEEIHITYIYDICKLLLKYGSDPNMVVGEKNSEYNIMNELRYVDKPYVGADTLRLMLENGGNPYNVCDGSSLYHKIENGIWFDITDGYADQEFYKNLFDCQFHCYLVLQGFTADEENPGYAEFKNHENYTYRIVKKDKNNWDLLTVKTGSKPGGKEVVLLRKQG